MSSGVPKRSTHPWTVHRLGTIDYHQALDLQMEFWEDVKNGGNHHLLLLEHNPVITLGRRTDPSHLLLSEDELENRGISLVKVNRGGSATYHGPGQLVGYVICKVSRVGGIHNLVERILSAVNEFLMSRGVETHIDKNNPGIWTNTDPPRKLAAVGMQNKEGISLHGFAININLPLSGFAAIVPCGLNLPVSTLAIETGLSLKVDEILPDVEAILLNYLM